VSKITADMLVAACGDESFDAGVSIHTSFDPLAGPGGPVKPAVYEGGSYQIDERWFGEGDARKPTTVVVIDNVPSQANRLEAALADSRSRLGLPELVLDLSGIDLPVHLPSRISSYLFPHRNADAYLRDAMLDGAKFPTTPLGKAIFTGTATNPSALLAWMPQALLFGFWQSHLGKKGPQSKLARSWVSELVGFDPATTTTKAMGLKGDPLNLTSDDAVDYDENNLLNWTAGDEKKAGKSKSKDSLAEIGHGQVLPKAAATGVSFRAIEQRATLSFAGLRRIAAPAEARALLAALGLVGHCLAFGRAVSLRSGCDLRPVTSAWTWQGANGDVALDVLSPTSAEGLLADVASRARGAGVELDGWGRDSLLLAPNAELRKVIEKAYPALEGF
jgi:CRISPR-associated protein Csb1